MSQENREVVHSTHPPIHNETHLESAQELGPFGMVRTMVGSLGVGNTARIVNHRLMHGRQGVDRPIELHSKQLAYPIDATMRDIANYDEVIKQGIYTLPDSLYEYVNGKPIVDLGGYIGITAAYFASRYPQSHVLSIEPHTRNYELLKENAARYQGDIEAIHAAVVPQSGSAHMAASQEGPETNYMSNVFKQQKCMSEHVVQAVSPEDILKLLGQPEEIGILKIDVEGAEKELFESRTIHRLLEITNIAMIETHDHYEPGSHAVVAEAMSQHGMTAAKRNPHTTQYIR